MSAPVPQSAPLLIWVSMGTAQILFLGLGASVAPPPDPANALVAQAMVLPAILTASASLALHLPTLLPMLPALTRFILRCALAEAAGVFGLVAVLVAGDPLPQYACAAFGLLAWLMAWPGAGPATDPPRGVR
jgi:hypothetical protein